MLLKVNSSVRLRSFWVRRGGKGEETRCEEKPEEGVAIEGEVDADELDGREDEKEGVDEDAESQFCEAAIVEGSTLGGRGEK